MDIRQQKIDWFFSNIEILMQNGIKRIHIAKQIGMSNSNYLDVLKNRCLNEGASVKR